MNVTGEGHRPVVAGPDLPNTTRLTHCLASRAAPRDPMCWGGGLARSSKGGVFVCYLQNTCKFGGAWCLKRGWGGSAGSAAPAHRVQKYTKFSPAGSSGVRLLPTLQVILKVIIHVKLMICGAKRSSSADQGIICRQLACEHPGSVAIALKQNPKVCKLVCPFPPF